MVLNLGEQILEINRQIDSQWSLTEEAWRDVISKRFYEQFIKPIEDTVTSCVEGEGSVSYKGECLTQLFQSIDRITNKMSEISGVKFLLMAKKTSGSRYHPGREWTNVEPKPKEVTIFGNGDVYDSGLNKRDAYLTTTEKEERKGEDSTTMGEMNREQIMLSMYNRLKGREK